MITLDRPATRGGGCKGTGASTVLLKGGGNDDFAPTPQSHIKEIISHNFRKSRDVKLDISEIKNLYKVKHPLKFEKFIHLFWNIIAIFGSFKNITLSEDICHF